MHTHRKHAPTKKIKKSAYRGQGRRKARLSSPHAIFTNCKGNDAPTAPRWWWFPSRIRSMQPMMKSSKYLWRMGTCVCRCVGVQIHYCIHPLLCDYCVKERASTLLIRVF